MKIIRIIKAKYNIWRNEAKIRKQDWYVKRVNTCEKCPFQSENFNENKGFRFTFLKYMNLNNPFCTVCGCEIKAKASSQMEDCPKNKW